MNAICSKLGYLIIAAMFIGFAGCGDDNNNINPNPDGKDTLATANYFKVKSGKIVYSTNGIEDNNPDVVLYFDDYGKKLRCENSDSIRIVDEVADFAVVLYPESKQYDSTTVDVLGHALRAIFHFTLDGLYEVYKVLFPDITKGTETIVGKSCTIYKWSVAEMVRYEVAGWNDITFLYIEEAEGMMREWRVKEFSEESVSADKFVIPDGYSEM